MEVGGDVDRDLGLVTAEAGIDWVQLINHLLWTFADRQDGWSIIQKQTGADHLTLGGALAANIHGRGLRLRPFVADVESNWPGNPPQRALRICDFYTKDNGKWIQSGSYTDLHPESADARMAVPRQFGDPMKKRLLDARESVWRAYFAGDRATLEKLIPEETIAINAQDDSWSGRAKVLEGSVEFVKNGKIAKRFREDEWRGLHQQTLASPGRFDQHGFDLAPGCLISNANRGVEDEPAIFGIRTVVHHLAVQDGGVGDNHLFVLCQ